MWTEKKKSGLMYKRSYQPRSSSTFFYCVCDWIELNWKRIEKEAQLRTTQKIVCIHTHTHLIRMCLYLSTFPSVCLTVCVSIFEWNSNYISQYGGYNQHLHSSADQSKILHFFLIQYNQITRRVISTWHDFAMQVQTHTHRALSHDVIMLMISGCWLQPALRARKRNICIYKIYLYTYRSTYNRA